MSVLRRAFVAAVLTTRIITFWVAAFPKVPNCGEPRIVGKEVLMSQMINAETFENSGESFVELQPEEGALLTITTGGKRRRRRRRRRLEGGIDLESLGLCEASEEDKEDDEEVNDDVTFQPLLDDGVNGADDDGCDWEDDDHELDEQNLGSDSQQVVVRIVDSLNGILSEKVPFSFANDSKDVFMWSRGQRGSCAHPRNITVEGVEGSGVVEVTSVKLRRDGWNEAALTFADAVDVTQKSDWCGSVNWIQQDSAHAKCDARSNAPKWKVWLNPQDKLLVTARLFCRQDSEERFATKVQLKMYKAADNNNNQDSLEGHAMILNSRIVGLKTKKESCTHVDNNSATGSWFFLELLRTERHLYEYAIAFQVQRNCANAKKGRFVLPKDQATCGWLAQQSASQCQELCAPSSKSNAATECRRSCAICSDCFESPNTPIYVRRRNCAFLRKKKTALQSKGKFQRYCQDEIAGRVCPEA